MAALVIARRFSQEGLGREIRERARLSVRELAEIVGIDASTLSRWERGQTRPCGLAASRWTEVCHAIEAMLQGPAVGPPRLGQLEVE
jgi:transcriptional regulator with XRE-family HTH domain